MTVRQVKLVVDACRFLKSIVILLKIFRGIYVGMTKKSNSTGKSK